jgi:hypothetical protein
VTCRAVNSCLKRAPELPFCVRVVTIGGSRDQTRLRAVFV